MLSYSFFVNFAKIFSKLKKITRAKRKLYGGENNDIQPELNL